MEKKLAGIPTKYYGVVSFALAGLAMYLTLSFSQVLSNGIYIILDGDLIEQYIPFIKMCIRDLLSGENLTYSWNSFLGTNTSLLYAYYVLSPFNLLYLILWNVDETIITALIIILKTGLAAYTFQYFLRKVVKCDGVESILFSLMYGLCSFQMLYGTSYNAWMEGVYMLPLVCAFIYELYENGKTGKLILAYAYLFITQFYMGYMVGVFSFVFWCVLLYLECEKRWKVIFVNILRYCGVVLLSIGIAACVWLPAILCLFANKADDTFEFIAVSTTLLDIYNNLFWGQMQGVSGIYPYIYCGLPVLLMVPIYFINKKIDIKNKIASAVMICFVLLTMIVNPMYQMIHAFDMPDNYGYRQAYLLTFVLCAVACKQSMFIKEIRIRTLGILLGINIFIYALVWNIQRVKNPVQSSNSGLFLCINIVFMLVWIFIVCFWQNKKIKAASMASLVVLMILVELCSSGYVGISKDLETVARKQIYYENWKNQIEVSVEELCEADSGFYRAYYGNDYVTGSAAWFGYKGLSSFSSAENMNVRDLYRKVGMYTSPALVEYYGITEPVKMILGVKYYTELNTPYISVGETNVNVTTNPYALSLGFAVDEEIMEYHFPGNNAFENINSMISAMCGEEIVCFEEVDEQDVAVTFNNACIVEEEQGQVIQKMSDDGPGIITYSLNRQFDKPIYAQFMREESYVLNNSVRITGGDENKVFGKGLLSVSYIKSFDSDSFSLEMNEETVSEARFQEVFFYAYNQEGLENSYSKLSTNQMIIKDYGNTFINAEIVMTEDKEVLFTSIPYDAGWIVKDNGVPVETIPVLEHTFLAIELEPGYHELSFEYEVPGGVVGKIISAASLLILILWMITDKWIVVKNKKRGRIPKRGCLR